MIQNESIQSVYVRVMWLLTLGLYICIPLGITPALLYYSILLLSVITIVITIVTSAVQQNISRFNVFQLFMLFIMTVSIVLSLIQTKETLTFSTHVMGILSFLEMVGAIYVVGTIRCTWSLKKFIYIINTISALVFAALSFTGHAYSSELMPDSLNLGFNNPNETAIYLMATICILVMFYDTLKKWSYKIPLLILTGYLIYLLYCTDSRTALIATVLVILYQLIARKGGTPPRVAIVIAVLIPLFFLLFYAYLYTNGYFENVSILGKPFYSGREEFFVEQLQKLMDRPLFGDVGKNHFTNMHNGPLAVMASIGFVGYGAYVLFVISTLLRGRLYIRSKSQTIALITLLAIFVHSSAEAAFLVGGAHYSIIVATFYLLLKGDGVTKQEWVSQQASNQLQ